MLAVITRAGTRSSEATHILAANRMRKYAAMALVAWLRSCRAVRDVGHQRRVRWFIFVQADLELRLRAVADWMVAFRNERG